MGTKPKASATRLYLLICAIAATIAPGVSLGQNASRNSSQNTASAAPVDPLSAINWLSNSVAAPTPAAPVILSEPGVTDSASVAAVSVSAIGAVAKDAVGLLPSNVTGFPPTLWGASRADDLAQRILSLPIDLLPSMQRLLDRLLLAELAPPIGGITGNDRLFLARIDRLLLTGALDQADALLARGGTQTAESFRRSFDTALLLGEEDLPCDRLKDAPELSPTFQARVFCLARQGDWDAAVLSLGTGRALGYLSEDEDALLSRFLDPDLFEGDDPLPQPLHPTPLTFRLYEAIGEHISTHTLPLAFAQADLRANIGWKARAEAGERLARFGAISDNQIFGLYTERKPAASGGIWDRMIAVQRLDRALRAGDVEAVAAELPELWTKLEQVGLELPFSRIFGPDLAKLSLSDDAAWVALRMGLLSNQSETVAQHAGSGDTRAHPRRDILLAIARGDTSHVTKVDAETEAVLEGFAATTLPVRLASLVQDGRLGEAILRAIALFTGGTIGDLDELSDALALFRLVGLEQDARQAALEFLILDRRG